MSGGILVIAEHREGALRDATLEALGAGLALGREGGLEVVALLLAGDAEALAGGLVGRAPVLRLLSSPDLAEYDPETYFSATADAMASMAPRLVLMGHTSQGMDLAPALAGRLGLQLATDCVAASLGGGALTVRRRPYGGKIEETLSLRPAATTVLTLRAGAFEPAPPGAETTRQAVTLSGLSRRHLRRFVERVKAAVEDVDIAEADVLVSVGRGIGSQDNIALAEALAEALSGVVSCSRPVADAGWLPQSRQVGTSGKTVRPRIYIALGISGAFQHVAGMKGAETILAVNKDPRAPIFHVAHYGIVEDLLDVLPALTEQLRG
jgi:electron transfer flavoprotein alpha subunit